MRITSTDSPREHGLANAIQRVQAAIDKRAERAGGPHPSGKTPGANALARLQIRRVE